MQSDFSSETAWRRLKLAAKVGVGGMLAAAALALAMNAAEGRPLLPPDFAIGGAVIIFALFLTPWFLWWAMLRLSEMTLSAQPQTSEPRPQDRSRSLKGAAIRATLGLLPATWLIYRASKGANDLYIVWVVAVGVAGASLIVLGAIVIELLRKPRT